MAAGKFIFTEASLRKQEPRATRYNVHDIKEDGLGLTVKPNGKKSFFWFRRCGADKKAQWHSLGDFTGSPSLDSARSAAHEINDELSDWKRAKFEGYTAKWLNPQPESMTYGELHAMYVERHLLKHAKNKASAQYNSDALFSKHCKNLKSRAISGITLRDMNNLHDRVTKSTGLRKRKSGGPHAANRLIQNIRAEFGWAIKNEIFDGPNPAVKVDLNEKVERQRYLKEEEIKPFFEAVRREQNRDVADFVLLLLLTGKRKGNLLAARWANINLDKGTWFIPDPKNRKPHTAALDPIAVEILRRRKARALSSEWVFPSTVKPGQHIDNYKKQWARIRKAAKLEDFRLHDLRHSLASWLASGKVSLHMVGGALGHASHASSARYAHLMVDPVKEAMTGATTRMLNAAKMTQNKLLSPVKVAQP